MPPTSTHCPYCAFQCGMTLEAKSDGALRVDGDATFPVNRGALCIKGWTSVETLRHEARLTHPLARDVHGELVPVTWDAAMARIAAGIVETQVRHGRDAVGVFGGGSLSNEKAYLLGKLARVALRTANIDYNGRFCMASAAAASVRAFGVDRGLPFPVEDIGHADALLVVGANPAETMPPLMQHFEAQRARGGTLLVVDPRRTATAAGAALHLQLTPGTDAALANGLLHVLLRMGLVDQTYLRRRTEGFDEVRAVVAAYWPERVERITGVPVTQIERAARILGESRRPMILTARGAEQQSHGVDNVLAFINVALALGAVGKPRAGWGCLTGQGNGQGGREHGQKNDQLPGYRRLDDEAARAHVGAVWGVSPEDLPRPGKSAFELLSTLGEPGGVRTLLVFGSNPAVSAPNARLVVRRLRSLDLLVVSDFFLSETAELADVVLPSAQWAEETGTVTNLEGRVILREAATTAPEGVRSDLTTLCALARALGHGEKFAFASSAEVFDELRRASQGGVADYAGITYEKLRERRGVFWPCPSVDHPGTPRLFEEGFPRLGGRARMHPVEHAAPAEVVNDEFPLYLTTGRVLAQYQSGTQTRRIGRLREIAPEPFVEMHPLTARELGLGEGDRVMLETRRGTAVMRVRRVEGIRRDTLFAPFHWGGEQSANRLTNPALDPISRMPEFKVCAARVRRLPSTQPEIETHFEGTP